MRLLHCSDAHADWSTAGFRRYGDVERAMEQTVEAAIAEKCGFYLFTGDLADPDGGATTLRASALAVRCASRLREEGIESEWVVGNHDVSEDGHGTSSLSPLWGISMGERKTKLVGTLRVRDAKTAPPHVSTVPANYLIADDTLLVTLPYPSLARPYDPAEVLAEYTRQWGGRVVVATHLQFAGIVPGEESREMARKRDVPFPWEVCRPGWLVLGGHYHERQVWTAPNGVRVHIAGALARLTHGEERNRPSYQIHEV